MDRRLSFSSAASLFRSLGFSLDLCVLCSHVLLVSRSLTLPVVFALSLAGFTRSLSRPLARSLASSLSRSLALLLFRSLVFSLSPCLARLLSRWFFPSPALPLPRLFFSPWFLRSIALWLERSLLACSLALSLSRFRIDAQTALR